MRASRILFIIALIAVAASFRILPHPPNMTPTGAIALFAGAYISDRRWAFAIPVIALLLGDLILGGYSLPIMTAVYGSFLAAVAIGMSLRRRRTPGPIAAATVAGSTLFFLVTNFAVWMFGTTYARSLDGLVACYTAALPFFGRTLAGDGLYVAAIFGLMALAERTIPALQEQRV
jgi:hypothetical protein